MKSFPWDSIAASIGEDGMPVYDRTYMASDLREVYETFFSNGVFMEVGDPSFQTLQDEGMNVLVKPGKCHILGTVGYEAEERKLAIQASGTQDRIDTVVLRWDANVDARDIDLYVLQGAPADVPVRPSLTRSETVWELGLCDVFVPAYALSVTQERITDTRLENDRCGIVTPFSTIDTTTFYDQIQAAVDKAVKVSDDALAGSLPGQLSDYKVTEDGTLVLPDLGLSTEALPGGIVKAVDIAGAVYKLSQYDSVTAGQIASNAVTSAKIADGAVTSAKIADGTIAAVDISNGAVTADKIGSSAVTTSKIADANVTLSKIAANSVNSSKIVDGSIATVDLANGCVTSAKIADGTIVNADIANATIAFGKLDAAAQKRVTDLESFRSSVSHKHMYASGGWYVKSAGGFVWVMAKDIKTGSGSWDKVTCPYVLPAGFRPSVDIQVPMLTANGGSWTGYMTIMKTGVIEVGNYGNVGSADKRTGIAMLPIGF